MQISLGLPGLVDTELVDVHHTVGGFVMVKKRRRYTREFKLEAVRLALESERPLAEVARELALPRMCYTGGSSSWRRGIRRRPSRGMGSGRGRKMKSGSCVGNSSR